MTPTQAYNSLRTTTDYFLKNCFVQIAGSPTPSGVVAYGIHYHGHYIPPPPGPGVMASWPKYKIETQANAAIWPPVQNFNAHSVQMIGSNTLAVPAGNAAIMLNGYLLGAGGPDIMVTGQLTGCTFAMQQVAAGIICTHIQPVAFPGAGQGLHTAIMNRGQFVGHPGGNLVCFGRNFYPGNATVIGVRNGGVWKIYAQQHSGPTTVAGAQQIL